MPDDVANKTPPSNEHPARPSPTEITTGRGKALICREFVSPVRRPSRRPSDTLSSKGELAIFMEAFGHGEGPLALICVRVPICGSMRRAGEIVRVLSAQCCWRRQRSAAPREHLPKDQSDKKEECKRPNSPRGRDLRDYAQRHACAAWPALVA